MNYVGNDTVCHPDRVFRKGSLLPSVPQNLKFFPFSPALIFSAHWDNRDAECRPGSRGPFVPAKGPKTGDAPPGLMRLIGRKTGEGGLTRRAQTGPPRKRASNQGTGGRRRTMDRGNRDFYVSASLYWHDLKARMLSNLFERGTILLFHSFRTGFTFFVSLSIIGDRRVLEFSGPYRRDNRPM